MKHLHYLFLLPLLCLVSSCEKNEDSNLCAPDAWVGNYSGISTCEGNERAVNLAINTVSERSILFAINTNSAQVQPVYPGTVVTGCTLETTFTNNGTRTDIVATLSGRELTLEEVASGALNRSCTYTVSRD
ncbi:MAG: hypothetical protein AAF597_13395 [Bacteroidota bacterium]